MIESSILLKPVFWIIAFAWSVYYGYYAFDIHGLNKSGTGYNPHYKWTQHIFNFFGCLIGWMALWFLIHLNSWSPEHLGWRHLILSTIAFAGITGNIPRMLVTFKS